MNESKKLIQQITEGIQDKKGKNIVIADLSKNWRYYLQLSRHLSGKLPKPSDRHCRVRKGIHPQRR